MLKPAVVIGGIVVALGTALAQQASPPQPTFRLSVDLVTIDVVATRSDGAPVHNLTAADFELFEDGVPQKIQAFQFINLSATSAVNPLPPGIASNEVEPGGIFAVVLDELGVQVDDVQQVRRVSERFFKETLLPNDYVTVIRSGAGSGFFLTSDRALALNAIAQSTGRRERTLGIEAPGGSEMAVQESPATIETFGVGENGRNSFGVLLSVVERLRHISARRKAILWFSRGGDLPQSYIESIDMGRAVGRNDEVFSRLIEAAHAANVAIYSLDPRGLQTPAADVKRDLDPFEVGALRDVASATGGRAVLNNDLNGALARIAAENRAYYLLGYQPSAGDGNKNRARKLSVKTRAPGVSLLHRKVYLPWMDARMTAPSLLESPLPVSDLPIALAPAAVALDRNRRGIIVPFEIGGGLANGTEVEYTVAALDPAGKLSGRATGVVTVSGGRALGEARLAVDAKTYQVRVAAIAAKAGTAGLAFATVHVPEGKSKQPRCSGFVFEQPGPRAALRQFSRDAPLTMSTLISAESLLGGAIAFGLGAAGGPVQRTWPVELGRPLANGLWRVVLSLKPPLPGGNVEIRVLNNGFVLGEGCTTAFVLR